MTGTGLVMQKHFSFCYVSSILFNVSLLSLCERGALLPVMDGRVWRRGSAASEYGVVPSLLLDVIDS